MISKDANYAEVYKNAQAWGIGGDKSRALNAVTTVITGALGGHDVFADHTLFINQYLK